LFSTKLCRDHIDILLSEMGYLELVQRLFEKMTFFLVGPLLSISRTQTRFSATECRQRLGWTILNIALDNVHDHMFPDAKSSWETKND
jgi:hypothetical protein